jgi:nicotinamide mononucleotide transporter
MKKWLLPIEIAAVISGLLYTYLLIEGSIWCWTFALISSTLFLFLCAHKRLYAESTLQLFYIGTAVLGFLNWGETGGNLHTSLPLSWHIGIVSAASALTVVSAYLLKNLTDAAVPLVDSFTTVFSIFATLLMIYLIPENWIYWIIIDLVSVYLYIKRKLFITAGLFVLYSAMAVMGMLEWMQQ